MDLTCCLIVIRILSLLFGLSTSEIVSVVVSEIEVSNAIGYESVVAGILVEIMSSVLVDMVYLF